MFNDLWFRLRSLLRRSSVEAELNDELKFHRDQQLESYLRAGLSREEARRRLGLDFGGLDQVTEDCRNARGVTTIEHLIQDVRFALRSLSKSPGFTIVAVLTLALGLGANTAIFSVVYGVLLRPLPYADSSTLLVLHETTPQVGTVSVSYPDFVDWRAQTHALSALAIVCDLDVNLGGISEPENIAAQAVSSNFLSILGVRPLLGRDFDSGEDRAGTAPVVLISYQLWQTNFGGNRDALGQTINLDGHPVTIVGVLPPAFRSTAPVSLVEPVGMWLTNNDAAGNRGSRGDMTAIGRLAPGVGIERARTEFDGVAAQLARAYPESNDRFGVLLQPIREVLVGDVRPALLILFGAVCCVLLIACSNVANLSLIRGAGRTREIALRTALGASRGRVVLQLLVESGVLAFLGGLLGLAFALGGIRGLARLIPTSSLGGAAVSLNGAVLAFAAAAVLASTIVFGLAPALQSARSDVQRDLKDGGRTGSTGRRHQRWRSMLAIAEVSLALVLLVGAGLMMRSLSRLLSIDPGVRTDHVLTMQMSLRHERYDKEDAKRQFWQTVLDGASRLPTVDVAALGTGVPLTNDHSRRDISIDGSEFVTGALPHPDVHTVSPGYAAALGIRLLQGRMFTAADTERTARVGLVNRTVADRFFAHADPVGRRFTFGRPQPGQTPTWITIVGVLDDTRLYGLDNPSRLEVYIPLRQSPRAEITLVVKSGTDPATLVPAIRAMVAAIDRDQPLSNVATMDELLGASVSTRRVTFVLLALFSALALSLAAIGIYGVMSHTVTQRTNELGIRLALGAQGTDVLKTIGAQALPIVAAGIGIGVVIALALTRLMSKLLFDVSAVDPVTFGAVGVGLALTALAACAVPCWRALRVNPLIALRRD